MEYIPLQPYGTNIIKQKLGETTSAIAEKINVGNLVGTVEKTSLTIASNIRSKMPAIIIGSLTLIATLTWNDALNSIINQYVPPKYRSADNAKIKFVYALVLTIISIAIISILLQYPSK